MPARTKGRAKFDFRGRAFVWWVDGDRYLRIASLDKKFVIALVLGTEDCEVVEVSGAEFPGVETTEPRPLWFVAPPLPKTSMGAWVERLLTWSFDESQSRRRIDKPPRFL
ncbi:MAG: hypothetical protein IT450_14650 [Phycisphaerales bacterium]|nr:hypothetical protein [Phycisphaerales bacterium]